MQSLKTILSNVTYFSVAWVFSSLNIILGTWVIYIPYVKSKLQLNDSQIGLALFCFALGILLFLPLVPYITKKVGLGSYTIIGVTLFAVSFLFPLLASNYMYLCISLFISGTLIGTTDVSMNALVSTIEKKDSSNFMSAAHGFFSLGGSLGAILGSFLMPLFSHPFYHILVMALFIVVTNLLLHKQYIHLVEVPTTKQKHTYQFKTLKPLYTIAFIAFVIMSSEGAIEHWSALYLLEIVQITQKNLLGLGFIVFSTTMTIGRFFGDAISEKLGSLKMVFFGCVLASIGYFFILSSIFTLTIFGFGVLGLGLSVIIPELFRVAGKTSGVKASVGISFVSGVGFVGFLLGPVLLGYISNIYNLKISFITLLFCTLLALLIVVYKLKSKTNDI